MNQDFNGAAIRQKRKELGLSAEALAARLGIDKANLYKWEKGHKPSDPEDFIKLMDWFNAKVESVPKVKKTENAMGNSSNLPVQDKYVQLLEESLREKRDRVKELETRLNDLEGRQRDFLAKVEDSIERYEHLVLAQIQNHSSIQDQVKPGSTPTVLQQVYKKGDKAQKKGS